MPAVLLIFAHPDDESFLAGGTCCRYADAGVRVALVVATRGDAGKTGEPPRCTPAELAGVRAAELARAAALLGLAAVHQLGHRDRELDRVAPEIIREQIVRVIRLERPEVVVSFDPNGANLHPDHVAISRFASDAVAAAADPRWFPASGPAHRVARLAWVPGRKPWLAVRQPNPAECPGVDFAIDVSAWRDRKIAALRAHATQHLGVERNFFSQPDADRLLAMEFFRQAFGPPLDRRPLEDLFEGL
jgi:N-acetylglucosamine malate deacetylase 2